jgi:hypothetical protein
VRERLKNLYMPEFMFNLQHQASNVPARYSARTHTKLKVGDLVSIKESFAKPFDFPLAVVVKVEANSANEVNTVTVRKSNREYVRRHVNELILLSKGDNQPSDMSALAGVVPEDMEDRNCTKKTKIRRNAAIVCENRNRELLHEQ